VIASGRRGVLKLYLLTRAGTTTKLSHRLEHNAERVREVAKSLKTFG
jgi:hypothetical protein